MKDMKSYHMQVLILIIFLANQVTNTSVVFLL